MYLAGLLYPLIAFCRCRYLVVHGCSSINRRFCLGNMYRSSHSGLQEQAYKSKCVKFPTFYPWYFYKNSRKTIRISKATLNLSSLDYDALGGHGAGTVLTKTVGVNFM